MTSTISPLLSHEDFINKSLLDSLDAQADAEPISSSSDSVATSNSSSDGGSPSVQYHVPMQSLVRPDPVLGSIDPQQVSSQNASYMQQAMYPSNTISDSSYTISADFTSEHDSRKFQKQQKADSAGNVVRTDMSSFLSTARARLTHRPVFPTNHYHETHFPTSPPDGFSGPITSPVQQQMSSFEHRANYDYSGQITANVIGVPNSFKDAFNSNSMSQPNQVNGHKAHQPLPQSSQPPSFPLYANVPQISSQTPYGPHIIGSAVTPSAVNGTSPGIPTKAVASVSSSHSLTNNSLSNVEEISTIFVVGFPDDMQEREFQNMFTFSPDFEAATLKIPNKESTAYGNLTNCAFGGLRNGVVGYTSTSGPNDPYNLVTVNQGGVVVDTGREGSVTSWPAVAGEEVNGHVNAGNVISANVPRKQIIGFAKFRTREAALIARDGLQGRRVDIDKGAVLKAEMAKKNLHTKRGVGPVSVSATGPPNSAFPVSNSFGTHQTYMNSTPANVPSISGPGMDSLSPREREIGSLSAMGLGGRLHQWRDQPHSPQDHLHSGASGLSLGDSSDDDRRSNLMNAMGLSSLGSITRGPRERAEEDERRRKEKDAVKVRTGNGYDPFHSLPLAISGQIPNTSGSGLISLPDQEDGIHNHTAWDDVRNQYARPRSLSRPDTPSKARSAMTDLTPSLSPTVETSFQFFPQSRGDFSTEYTQSNSTPISLPVAGDVRDVLSAEIDLSRSLTGLDMNTVAGKTSPELPSPSSGASSRNAIDQNPPINTLYVGNLPTSSGVSHDVLEANIRELFQSRPGYRRLCFRQKPNGPMCFVEFDGVSFATKALNDLYGNTVKGSVKGGIRLSYSKNPLGVRTPAHVGNNPSQAQLQINVSPSEYPSRFAEDQQLRTTPVTGLRDMTVPTPPVQVGQVYTNDFFSPSQFSISPSGPTTPTSLSNGPTNAYIPRFGFNLSPSGNAHAPSSFSPFGLSNTPPPPSMIPEQQTARSDRPSLHHHFTTTNDLEAARAC